MKAHFICRNRKHVRATPHPIYESGMWDISEDDAKALVGGFIYLHETKAAPSYFSGVVTSYRPADGDHAGRWVFKVTSTGQHVAWEGKDHGMAHYSGLINDQYKDEVQTGMAKPKFMSRMLGDNYRTDSNRTRTFSYMFDRSPHIVSLHDMAKTFGATSIYGPGVGEECTADHLRQEVTRIARRAERYGVPYTIVWHGRDHAALRPA